MFPITLTGEVLRQSLFVKPQQKYVDPEKVWTVKIANWVKGTARAIQIDVTAAEEDVIAQDIQPGDVCEFVIIDVAAFSIMNCEFEGVSPYYLCTVVRRVQSF